MPRRGVASACILEIGGASRGAKLQPKPAASETICFRDSKAKSSTQGAARVLSRAASCLRRPCPDRFEDPSKRIRTCDGGDGEQPADGKVFAQAHVQAE